MVFYQTRRAQYKFDQIKFACSESLSQPCSTPNTPPPKGRVRSEARLSDSEALNVREVNVSAVNMREVKVRKECS
jgi:hypothetical protein